MSASGDQRTDSAVLSLEELGRKENIEIHAPAVRGGSSQIAAKTKKSTTPKSRINSRDKGGRGERDWRDVLRSKGYIAERGQQRSGSPDSPDVRHNISGIHFEVKYAEYLRLWDAVAQATKDTSGSHRDWVVVHRRNHSPWLAIMSSDLLFTLLKEAGR